MNFWSKIKLVWEDKGLRGRLLFVLGALVLSRLLAAIPVPGIDTVKLANFFAGNQFFGFLNIFSGASMSNFSIVMLGVGPAITALIIMQVLTMVSDKLKAMYQDEGQAGRDRFNQISRMITVPIALIQGFSLILILEKSGVIPTLGIAALVANLLVVTAGSMLMVWIGDLITEFGIGNGISLLIFAGIVARLPTTLSQLSLSFTASDIPTYVLFLVMAVVIIAGVVFISEAERPVPVTYAKQVRGSQTSGGISTYLPLRLNQAGVIPIIFATSLLIFPQTILSYIAVIAKSAALKTFAAWLTAFLANAWAHGILYFVLVFVFTYFYTAVTFDPDQISKNLQQGGAFIPGVRPGQATSDYLARVLTRITLVGALFLGIVAVLPYIITYMTNNQSLTIGGTALLIVVTVIIEFVKQIEGQVTMREY